MKPGRFWTGVTGVGNLLGSEMENKGTLVGMKGPSGRGQPKAKHPSTFLIPYQLFGCAWITFMD